MSASSNSATLRAAAVALTAFLAQLAFASPAPAQESVGPPILLGPQPDATDQGDLTIVPPDPTMAEPAVTTAPAGQPQTLGTGDDSVEVQELAPVEGDYAG